MKAITPSIVRIAWSAQTQNAVNLGEFDVVLTNPPFGAKIPVVGRQLLGQYQLGRKWQRRGGWAVTPNLLDKQPPQVLFIERCIQLLREGGRMGIVLPEGVFGNPSDRYIWEYVSGVCSVTGVVSLYCLYYRIAFRFSDRRALSTCDAACRFTPRKRFVSGVSGCGR